MIDPTSVLSSPVEPIEISWLTHDRDDTGRTVSRGTFTSPAPHLPDRSKVAAVISISPVPDTERVVVLMPAWNEHDPRVRVGIAQRLAVHGITSIILEGPLRVPTPRPRRWTADCHGCRLHGHGRERGDRGTGHPRRARRVRSHRRRSRLLDGGEHSSTRLGNDELPDGNHTARGVSLTRTRVPRRDPAPGHQLGRARRERPRATPPRPWLSEQPTTGTSPSRPPLAS